MNNLRRPGITENFNVDIGLSFYSRIFTIMYWRFGGNLILHKRLNETSEVNLSYNGMFSVKPELKKFYDDPYQNNLSHQFELQYKMKGMEDIIYMMGIGMGVMYGYDSADNDNYVVRDYFFQISLLRYMKLEPDLKFYYGMGSFIFIRSNTRRSGTIFDNDTGIGYFPVWVCLFCGLEYKSLLAELDFSNLIPKIGIGIRI
ncbi:MAG: hypothetical protein JW827_03660 [Spirochaetes bacterium]|nr:hypothetical protein [Spirochaetota bacterium]